MNDDNRIVYVPTGQPNNGALTPPGEQERQQLRVNRDRVFDAYRVILADQQQGRKVHPHDAALFFSALGELLLRLRPKMDRQQPQNYPACYVLMNYYQDRRPELELGRLALKEVSQYLELIHISDLPRENVAQG